MAQNSPDELSLAAVFQDFENIYYHLKTEYQDPPTLNEAALDILRNLREHLVTKLKIDPVIQRAYADFERLQDPPLGSMYLMGIDTRNVLGTEHKNAADMRLCIDLMETLYTRREIRHFVLVAGDRDYIPVVQHLRSQARQVRVVAFRKGLSGDLLAILGQENLIDAETLLSEEVREGLLRHRAAVAQKMGLTITGKITLPEAPKPKAMPSPAQPTAPATAAPATAPMPRLTSVPENRPLNPLPVKDIDAIFAVRTPVVSTDARTCLAEIIDFKERRHLAEIWLSPFVRQLTDALPFLSEHERKMLIVELERHGAIAVEKRDGNPYPYSVILINYSHPSVIDLLP